MNYSEDIKNTVFTINYKYNKSSSLMYTLVLLIVIGTFISLPFVKVTVDSKARGMLRSKKENVKITSLVQGKVTYVNLKNNQSILKGELLLKIKPLIEEAEEQTKKKLLHNQQKQFTDLTLLCNGRYNLLKTELYQKEKNLFFEKIKELETQREQFYSSFQRSKKGFHKGVISEAMYEKESFDLAVSESKISSYKNEKYNSWQSKKTQLEKQIKAIEGEIAQLSEKKKNYTIIAPISGTIVNYSGIKQGAYFNGNEILGEISPDDEIIVECYILPKNIGFIKTGQEVNLQMDAFNYNQWGFGKAIVHEIDRNITINEQQSFFRIRCKLETNELILKNGYKARLKKGMTCTARLTLTERSLWNLLFDKVDDWFNPKIIDESISKI